MATNLSYFNPAQNTSPMMPDYYKLLEVGNDASDMEIKRAYRRKVQQLHPARNPSPEAVEQFNLIN
ncbi:MAG TPA: J domain-containing protein, partial [Chitinophagales bacterium]|nr:J domain-containing protein [Chitinophagales bacterium]